MIFRVYYTYMVRFYRNSFALFTLFCILSGVFLGMLTSGSVWGQVPGDDSGITDQIRYEQGLDDTSSNQQPSTSTGDRGSVDRTVEERGGITGSTNDKGHITQCQGKRIRGGVTPDERDVLIGNSSASAKDKCTVLRTYGLVKSIGGWISIIAGILASTFITLAGIFWILSGRAGGDVTKQNKAKAMLVAAIIGFAIAAGSQIIIRVMLSLLG